MSTENTGETLGLILKDEQLGMTVLNNLSDKYQVLQYNSIESILENTSIAHKLVLCDEGFLIGLEQEGLTKIKKAFPDSQTLVLGSNSPIEAQVLMLRHGARGYFNKALISSKLEFALQSITNGEVWVERHLISGLIDNLTQGPQISDEQRLQVESLSPKELEVADLVSHGATNKVIAIKMNITERTVKAHLTTIFQKMGMSDRLSLAIFFRELR